MEIDTKKLNKEKRRISPPLINNIEYRRREGQLAKSS